MNKNIFLLLVLLFSFNLGFSQNDPNAPFLKTKTIPSFTIYNVTDSSKFTNLDLEKNKRTIFIYFGPDCGHCIYFTKKMMDSIHLFENTQIVMVSSFNFSNIRKFYDDNKLASCPFITVGMDEKYFFVTHYEIRQFPSAYVYDKKGKFVKIFSSEIDIKELAETK
jgi:hypothetical protein